jgi:hypothetical protein
LTEPVETCAHCGEQFIPNRYQLGQKRRGVNLYCSSVCAQAREREKAIALLRTEEQLAKRRERYRRSKEQREAS